MTAIPPVRTAPLAQPPSAPTTAGGGTPALGQGFNNAIESVSSSLREADQLTQQVATGQLEDLSQLTTATAKAQLAMELTVAFRDRAVQSFQQIMQMQV
ncbi:MAG: flagellar hook-basal body complex protein FliE [Actinomycetota bacterium]